MSSEQDNEDGMSKYGVVLDDDKVKTAEEATQPICAVCGKALDDAGACPVHGTKPLEKKP